ncbi:type II toxin-antitoxin system RelE/ParE family toxin [Inquilinus sp. CAU 1745]|uniref:type II toxin-antitoxin system RelE/ParE family toxin n=1 Tax=Inquilinus sp. CAU 1745 TaxID=3140369 RepID=UPI00325BB4F9
MRLEWSIPALRDREEIFDHIEAEDPRAAIAVDEAISGQIGRLRHFPESGRLGRIEGTREMVVAGTPYVVGYCITGEVVRILRVLHGARRWPEDGL